MLANKTGEAYTGNPVGPARGRAGSRVTAHPEVLVQLRDELAADAEGFDDHRRQYKIIRNGLDGKVRRSPQAVACRKRYVRELGLRLVEPTPRRGGPLVSPNYIGVGYPNRKKGR